MKRKSERKAVLLGVSFVLGLACLAPADPITIQISGEVNSLGGYTEAIPDTIYAGVAFTGTYTYNSSTADSDSNPQRGEYVYDSPYGISILVGGYEFKTAPSHTGQVEMRILTNDLYIVFSDENVSIPSVDFEVDTIRWDLHDNTYDAISSDALPTTAPVLDDWNYNVLKIYGAYGPNRTGLAIYGTVTQATPEPLTGVLMTLGVLFLRRRR